MAYPYPPALGFSNNMPIHILFIFAVAMPNWSQNRTEHFSFVYNPFHIRRSPSGVVRDISSATSQSVRSTVTAMTLQLDRRTLHGTVRAEDAAIGSLWPNQSCALSALMKEET